jgi:hypothetical protein
MAEAMARGRAERLRRQAVELAAAYERLASRVRLDPEILTRDAAAVARAWWRLRDRPAQPPRGQMSFADSEAWKDAHSEFLAWDERQRRAA